MGTNAGSVCGVYREDKANNEGAAAFTVASDVFREVVGQLTPSVTTANDDSWQARVRDADGTILT